MKTDRVFERHEKKYMLSAAQQQALLAELDGRLQPDRYGRQTIQSLYCDTPDFAVIRQSLEKPAFRQKLRIRAYGRVGEQDRVYLELKKKFDGVSYKRRIELSPAEARRYLGYGLPPEENNRHFQEIDFYVRQLRPQPAVLIAYDRQAYVGVETPSLRLTFDSGLRYRTDDLEITHGDYGGFLLPPEQRLLEIKTANTLPLWLTEALTRLRIYPQSFSKYGHAYTYYLSQKGGKRDAV